MRCSRDFTLVYINQLMAKLVSLCIVSLKVTESINDVERGLPIFAHAYTHRVLCHLTTGTHTISSL